MTDRLTGWLAGWLTDQEVWSVLVVGNESGHLRVDGVPQSIKHWELPRNSLSFSLLSPRLSPGINNTFLATVCPLDHNLHTPGMGKQKGQMQCIFGEQTQAIYRARPLLDIACMHISVPSLCHPTNIKWDDYCFTQTFLVNNTHMLSVWMQKYVQILNVESLWHVHSCRVD